MGKVVSLADRRKAKEEPKKEESVDYENLFEDAVRKNAENKKRVEEERKKKNRSVINSLRRKK